MNAEAERSAPRYIAASVDVHITHIRPGETGAVMAEIARLATPHRVQALAAGQVIRLVRGLGATKVRRAGG